ncbi:MAG: hypothetical protein MAG795_00047 [Candidatus Woesearchaeota archaeon]|nr:hypothetical protein [Candidatus Woesearchaeota archaeon]
MSLMASFLNLPAVLVIAIVAFVVSVFSIIVWKLVTDQDKMKSIQDRQKKMRKEMKKCKDNPDKMMKLQKKSMELSMEIFPQTMKIMLITIIPIFLIFNWLGSSIAYQPLMPGEEFTSTVMFESEAPGEVSLTVPEEITLLDNSVKQIEDKSVSWLMTGKKGTQKLKYTYGDEEYILDLSIGKSYNKAQLEKQKKLFFLIPMGDGISAESNIKKISVDLEPTRPLGNFSIFGWNPGWFAIYFILSLVFSTVLRKLLKVY